MRLSQETYVDRMVAQFLPTSVRPVTTPMTTDITLSLSESMSPDTPEGKADMKRTVSGITKVPPVRSTYPTGHLAGHNIGSG